MYWQAWCILRDDRHYGDYGAMGTIYYQAISRYASDFGICGDDLDIFVLLIRAMDSEFMAYVAEKNKKPESEETDT